MDGMTFDSKAEMQRWCELKLMLRANRIRGLKRQVEYILIPAQKDDHGKVIERPVKYIADFVYTDCETGEKVIEDVKGVRTKEYTIKRKLMLYMYGYRIREVRMP